MFLQILQNSHENISAEVTFWQSSMLSACNFINPNAGLFRGLFCIGRSKITPLIKNRYNYAKNLKFGT